MESNLWKYLIFNIRSWWHKREWNTSYPEVKITMGWKIFGRVVMDVKYLYIVILFTVWIIFFAEYIGILCILKWMWSWSEPISTKFILYLFSIPLHIFFNVLSTSKVVFATYTRLYDVIKKQTFVMTLCDMNIFHFIKLSFHFATPIQASGNSFD